VGDEIIRSHLHGSAFGGSTILLRNRLRRCYSAGPSAALGMTGGGLPPSHEATADLRN